MTTPAFSGTGGSDPAGAVPDPAHPAHGGAASGTGVPGPVPKVAVVGAGGHGLWHRREIEKLAARGRVRLAGLCDVRPIEPADGAPVPADLPTFANHLDMLTAVRPDVVVVCTPPHTHLPIARDALRSGADVLLEKPPVLSMAEHNTLAAVLAETGRACQVGFQALGSAALAELTVAVAAGRLGEITGIATVASWQRDDAYYARSPWAGRRRVDGRPALDGALANPLAHALMQALAVAAAATGRPAVKPITVELERYRTRPIEVEDTAFLRATIEGGPSLLAAVTLCGEEHIAGEVIVYGTAGTAVLEYPTDRLLLPAPAAEWREVPDGAWREVPGRVGLLENLLDHRADPAGVPLIVPLARTAPFTELIEVVAAAPEPHDVDPAHVRSSASPGDPSRTNTIIGINTLLRTAARHQTLPPPLPTHPLPTHPLPTPRPPAAHPPL